MDVVNCCDWCYSSIDKIATNLPCVCLDNTFFVKFLKVLATTCPQSIQRINFPLNSKFESKSSVKDSICQHWHHWGHPLHNDYGVRFQNLWKYKIFWFEDDTLIPMSQQPMRRHVMLISKDFFKFHHFFLMFLQQQMYFLTKLAYYNEYFIITVYTDGLVQTGALAPEHQ